MANYYSQFVAEIPYKTEEQLAWLKREIEKPDEIDKSRRESCTIFGLWGGDEDDYWNLPDLTLSVSESSHMLYLEGEHDPHHVFFLVAVYAQKFNLFRDEPWTMEVAYTCDGYQPDGFGGGGYGIYKGEVFYASTSQSIERWIESVDQTEKAIIAWEKGLNTCQTI